MLNVNRTIREHAWQMAPLGRAAWAGAMGLAGATRIPYQGRMTAPAGVDVRQFAALIERVARLRDRVAFAQLFHHFAPRVKAYLMRLGSGSDAAEELAQEVMLTVWRRAETFDAARAGASTWIFAIARNRRIDALRRAPRINFEPDDPDLAPTAPAAPGKAADAPKADAPKAKKASKKAAKKATKKAKKAAKKKSDGDMAAPAAPAGK